MKTNQYFLVAWYRESMPTIDFGSYHTLPYPLRLVLYSTCYDPVLKCRVIGLYRFLMFGTIALFTMMSMAVLLSRSNQLGGILLNFSGSVTWEKNK